MGLNHFLCSDKHCPYASTVPIYREPSPVAKLRLSAERQGGFSLCARVFCLLLFLFSIFILFSPFTPRSWSLPPPLSRWFVFSLSQCSCPPLIFSPQCCFSLIFFFSTPSHPLSLPLSLWVMALLFLLRHLHPSPSLTCLCASLTLFPSVLWKLSLLWGCLAEDPSPSAPAVPLKVT